MSDDIERSVASDGSVPGKPVAWGVMRVGGASCIGWFCGEGRWASILDTPEQAETIRKSFGRMEKNWAHEVVPLYRSPTLTDAEREAINRLSPCGDPLASRTVVLTPEERRVFHGLLERMK